MKLSRVVKSILGHDSNEMRVHVTHCLLPEKPDVLY